MESGLSRRAVAPLTLRRPRPRSLAAATLLAALTLGLAGCASSGDHTADGAAGASLFGPFAGYSWTGHVHQVSATVIVPGVIAISQEGTAGTWIGAEGPINAKTLYSPFFQVGVNEIRLKGGDGRPGPVGYFGFWSSTGRGFHPVYLFQVYPGDSVHLAMTLTHGEWRISADDLTQRDSKSFLIASPRGATYDEAIWTQEDVSDNHGDQLPYPEVSAPTFLQARANGQVPRSRSLTTSWMSTRIGVFGPGPLRSDRFAVRQIHPSPAALRYEEITDAEFLPAGAFDENASLWTRHTAQSAIRKTCMEFAQVLEQTVTSFRSYQWPADVRVQVRRLSDAIAATRLAVLKLSHTPLSRQRQVAKAFERPGVETERLGDQIRHLLRVPRVDPSGLLAVDYLRAHA